MADKYSPGMEFQSWRSLPKGPLSELTDAAKRAALIYGLHKSGAIKALDQMGLKQNENGSWGYKPPTPATPPAGAVPPAAPAAAAPIPPTAPVAPAAPQPAPVEVGGPISTPTIESTPLPTMTPSDAGKKLLEGEYHGAAEEDQFKPRDVAQDMIPQQYAQGIPPPNAGYPPLPQSNGGLMQFLAAFV